VSASRSDGRTSATDKTSSRAAEPSGPAGGGSSALTADERSQIAARLRLSPSERLRYLEDMLAFEEQARRARRLP
jgi:hypothetical protein